ncbi:MAG: hypothetical protein O7G88_23195 [bacterium]|nr:hypothetical protein [bacterium]
MPIYRNAFYWFIGLLVLLILGFWQSYFSQLPDAGHITHHAHAVVMLTWVLLLIVQSWLIRNRRNARHRLIGKTSFVIAPAVVVTALYVNFFFQANAEDPVAPLTQSIYWLGYCSAGTFTIMYVLAIRHRRQMHLHARYMVGTSLVFVVPGMSRVIENYLAPTGVLTESFVQFGPQPWCCGCCYQRGAGGPPFQPGRRQRSAGSRVPGHCFIDYKVRK